jgi:hypothetical protein
MKNSKTIILILVASILLCLSHPAIATTDTYHFFDRVGRNQVLDFEKSYNSSFVDNISGFYNMGITSQLITITSSESKEDVVVDLEIPINVVIGSQTYRDAIRFYSATFTPQLTPLEEIPFFISSVNSTHVNIKIRTDLNSGSNYILLAYGGIDGDLSIENKSNESAVYDIFFMNTTTDLIQNTQFFNGNFNAMHMEFRPNSTGGSNVQYIALRPSTAAAPMFRTGTEGTFVWYPQTSGYTLMSGTNGVNLTIDIVRNNNNTSTVKLYNEATGQTITNISTVTTSEFTGLFFAPANTNGRVTFYKIGLYNTTETTTIIGGFLTLFPYKVQSNIQQPTGIFSTANATGINVPSGGWLHNVSINFTPHITDWKINSTQTNGKLNFSYVPADRQANYTWELSNDSEFTQIILSGNGTYADINSSGWANIDITDFTKITPGNYSWRLKSSEAGNNTTFASQPIQISSGIAFEIRLIDGVTGDWIHTNTTSSEIVYSDAYVGNNVYVTSSTGAETYWWMAETTVRINQAGTSYNLSALQQTGAAEYWAGVKTNQIQLGVPVTIEIFATGAGRPWANQTYVLQFEEHQTTGNVLNLSIERYIYNTATRQNSTHGIIHDSRGEAISNATVTVNNSSTGAFVGTYSASAGGQYAYYNTTAASQYFSFSAVGYSTVSGIVDRIKQDVRLAATPNITISVFDSETGQPIRFFTTFLGDNQTIRSADNGTVAYDNVTEGAHQIIIQADGYAQATRQIQVSRTNTEFRLFLQPTQATEFTTPHYVRFFYRTLAGAPVPGLDISVYEGNSDTPFLQGITGTDGSVAFRMNETIKYKIVAQNNSTGVYHEFTTYPKSSEYIVIIRSGNATERSNVLQNISYKITDTGLNDTYAKITVGMASSTPSDVIDYNITIYKELDTFTSQTGSFSSSKEESFNVPYGSVYSVVITFTDADGKSITVSKTIRLDSSELKAKFKIPGFTEQWHYNCLCVAIVILSAFSFSERTSRIGGIIIPAEFFGMTAVGWLPTSVLAVCLILAVVIFAVIYFFERMDRE